MFEFKSTRSDTLRRAAARRAGGSTWTRPTGAYTSTHTHTLIAYWSVHDLGLLGHTRARPFRAYTTKAFSGIHEQGLLGHTRARPSRAYTTKAFSGVAPASGSIGTKACSRVYSPPPRAWASTGTPSTTTLLRFTAAAAVAMAAVMSGSVWSSAERV